MRSFLERIRDHWRRTQSQLSPPVGMGFLSARQVEAGEGHAVPGKTETCLKPASHWQNSGGEDLRAKQNGKQLTLFQILPLNSIITYLFELAISCIHKFALYCEGVSPVCLF